MVDKGPRVRQKYRAGFISAVIATAGFFPFGLPPAAWAATTNDRQLWLDLTVTKKLTDDLSLQYEVVPRLSTGTVGFAPLSAVPPSLIWKVADGIEVQGGYVYAYIESGKAALHEDRLFQHVAYTYGHVGRLKISGRTRVEERFFSNSPGMQVRLRQQTNFALPLSSSERPIVAIFSVENHFNLKSGNGEELPFVNQNRFLLGASVPLSKGSNLLVGVMNQRQNEEGYVQSNANLLLSLSFEL